MLLYAHPSLNLWVWVAYTVECSFGNATCVNHSQTYIENRAETIINTKLTHNKNDSGEKTAIKKASEYILFVLLKIIL